MDKTQSLPLRESQNKRNKHISAMKEKVKREDTRKLEYQKKSPKIKIDNAQVEYNQFVEESQFFEI